MPTSVSTVGIVALAVRLARPWFLAGGALLYLAGWIVAGGGPASGRFWRGLWAVLAVQLFAQLVNEVFDIDADRYVQRRTPFTGGSGVLVAHPQARTAVLAAAWVCATVALVLGWSLSGRVGLVVLAAIVVSWAYSAPPFRWLATGRGEVAASAVVAGGVPATGALAASGGVPADLGVLIVAWVFGHHAMMVLFELPDVVGDATAGKRTLAVRVGPRAALRLARTSFVLGGIIGLIWSLSDAAPTVWVALGWVLPLAVAAAVGRIAWRGREAILAATGVVGFLGPVVTVVVAGWPRLWGGA